MVGVPGPPGAGGLRLRAWSSVSLRLPSLLPDHLPRSSRLFHHADPYAAQIRPPNCPSRARLCPFPPSRSHPSTRLSRTTSFRSPTRPLRLACYCCLPEATRLDQVECLVALARRAAGPRACRAGAAAARPRLWLRPSFSSGSRRLSGGRRRQSSPARADRSTFAFDARPLRPGLILLWFPSTSIGAILVYAYSAGYFGRAWSAGVPASSCCSAFSLSLPLSASRNPLFCPAD